jgi:hypothetical protein
MAKKQKRSLNSRKLDLIENKIDRIEKEEKLIEKEEKLVEKKLDEISKEEHNLEKVLIKIGNLSFRKKHFLELVRASAGAFLGVALGRGLIGLDSLAKNLAWNNIVGILIFILMISGLLLYKTERDKITSKGIRIIFPRLMFIYFVSLVIEVLSIFLFNISYDSFETLLKMIIVGSYAAMASAITFSISGK